MDTNKRLFIDTVWLHKNGSNYVYYLKYLKVNGTDSFDLNYASKLFWGNNSKSFQTLDTFEFYTLQSCRFKKFIDNVIFIETSEGNGYSASVTFLLPLDSFRYFTKVYQWYEFFPKKNIVVYPGESKTEFLNVVNIKTLKKFIVSEKIVCDEIYFYLAINSVKLKGEMLYYNWNTNIDCLHNRIYRRIKVPNDIFK